MTSWDYIKNFYKQSFGIEGWIVELCANLDVLILCASGASNKSISELCQVDLDDIVEILMNTFKFAGWYTDLPVNPYKLYTDLNGDYDKFYIELKNSNVFELSYIEDIYSMCKTMKEIEERITDEWI
jgi:hypothetical protein